MKNMGGMNIFKLLEIKKDSDSDKAGVAVGINLKISEIDFKCPITSVCYTDQELHKEIRNIREGLERIAQDAKDRLKRNVIGEKSIITPDMAPGDMWKVLEEIPDEEVFIEQFNSLEEDIRGKVAEYVLTQCSVFSGKGAVFSARYNEGTKFIE